MKLIVIAAIAAMVSGCTDKTGNPEKVDREVIYTAFDLSDKPTLLDGCSLLADYATVTQKQYDNSGQAISVIEFKRGSGDTFAATMAYGDLSVADSRNLTSAIKVGDQVFVRYSVCGSGGYSTIIDIIKKW